MFFKVFCCSLGWVENGDVAKGDVEVWENVKAVIKWYKQQAPSQQPRNVQSKFVLVRLQFFHDIAMILNKFLVVSPFYAFLLWESVFSLNLAWWVYYMFVSA